MSIFLKSILGSIREAAIYSVIAHEARDVSKTEQLCVCIRWVDKAFEIHEDFLELMDIPKTDAETISNEIKKIFKQFSLSINQCYGQAYDGASNMSSHISGVAARIQADESKALYVHCLAHCTNLCLQSVTKKVAVIWEALNLTMQLSDFILYSPKQTSLFQTLQNDLSPGNLRLKPLCPTRWTVRTGAMGAIIVNYNVLRVILYDIHDSGRDEYSLKAGGYFRSLEKFNTYFGLKLSYLLFSATEQLSIALQGRNTSIQEAVNAANLAINHLVRLRGEENFNRFYARAVEDSKDLITDPTIPRFKQPPKRIDQGSTTHRFDSLNLFIDNSIMKV